MQLGSAGVQWTRPEHALTAWTRTPISTAARCLPYLHLLHAVDIIITAELFFSRLADESLVRRGPQTAPDPLSSRFPPNGLHHCREDKARANNVPVREF